MPENTEEHSTSAKSLPWPDITNSFIYKQARAGGADHVEAMRLAMDPDADIPACY